MERSQATQLNAELSNSRLDGLLRRRGRGTALRGRGVLTRALEKSLVTLNAVLRDDDGTIGLGLTLSGGPGKVVTADLGAVMLASVMQNQVNSKKMHTST